jgi:hypothetical protein
MISLIGAIVGALVLTYLAAIFIEWALIARILSTPAVGIAVSSMIGTIAVILLRGWVYSLGGPYSLPPDALLYVLAGSVIGVGRMILRRRSDLAEDDDSLRETFQ